MKRLFAVSIMLCLSAGGARAATLEVLDSQLIGASDVIVNGLAYNVEFLDGSCVDVFSGCDELSDFTFNTPVAADAASQALLDQVFTSSNFYDVFPASTRGIESLQAGNLFTPYGFLTPATVLLDGATNFANTGTDLNNCMLGQCSVNPLFDFSESDQSAFARWTAIAPVPVPAGVWLFGTALIGLAGFCRRRKVA